jgi:hypothetical protein
LPQLDASIAEAVELVPQAKGELAAVDDANTALVRLEDHAFQLVGQKQLDQAWQLLNGEEYRRNKNEYAQGLASFSNRLKEHSERAIEAAGREAMWFMIAAICLGALVALILLVGLISMLRILRLKSVSVPTTTITSATTHG